MSESAKGHFTIGDALMALIVVLFASPVGWVVMLIGITALATHGGSSCK